jgi:hypothetical protein
MEEHILAPTNGPTDRNESMARMYLRLHLDLIERRRKHEGIEPDEFGRLVEMWATCIALAMFVTTNPAFPPEFIRGMNSKWHEHSEELFAFAVAERATELFTEWTADEGLSR